MASEQHFCPNCGAQLTGEPKFCPTCGYQLTKETDQPGPSETEVTREATHARSTVQPAGGQQAPNKNKKPRRKRGILIAVLAIVVVLVIIGGYLVGKTISKPSVDSADSSLVYSATSSSKASSRASSSSVNQSSSSQSAASAGTHDNQLVRATLSPRETAAAIAVYADRTSIWPAISSDGMADRLDVQIVDNDFDLAEPGENNVRYDVSAGSNGSDPALCYTLRNGTVFFYTVYSSDEDEDYSITPTNTTTVSQIVEYLNSENEAQSVENLSKRVVLSDER